MAFTNNVMIVRHGLLAKLVKLWKDNQLVEEIDHLPIKLSPRHSKVRGRCCVHKERAVWKYKMFPLLGFDMTDEKDELTPLSHYAQEAITRKKNLKENILCVMDEACSNCVQVNYEISNLCRGCVARSCYMNCPKNAIHFKANGQAEIDHDTCISCGICHQSCPYHARAARITPLSMCQSRVRRCVLSRPYRRMSTVWSISTRASASIVASA